MSRFLVSAVLAAIIFSVWTAPSTAQTPPPSPTPAPQDLAKFGFPIVAASQTIQPDQSVTLTSGGQSITIPAGAYLVPVKFDFLVGDNAEWQKILDSSSEKIVATFAFRVTDVATDRLIGRANTGKGVQYRYTSPLVTGDTRIYRTSATKPPIFEKMEAAGNTIEGQTVARTFNGSGVGWFVTVPDESPTESSGMLTIVVAIVGGLVLLMAGIIGARLFRKKA